MGNKIFYITMLIVINTYLSSAQIVINEVCPNNYETYYDEDYDTPDWIEIYNSGDEDISIKDYRISDKDNFTEAWILPDTIIPAKGYITVFASAKERNSSDNLILETSGEGMYYSSHPKSFSFLYNEFEGDICLDLQVLSLRNESVAAAAGLVIRNSLDDDSDFWGVFTMSDHRSFGDYAWIIKDDGGVVNIGNEYPECYLRLEKSGNIIKANIVDSKGLVISSTIFEGNISDTFYAGAAVFSFNKNQLSQNCVNNFRINGKDVEIDSMIYQDFNCHLPGNTFYSEEIHTNFKLSKDGDAVFLWNDEGQLIDNINFNYLPANVSFGRFPDGSSEKYCFSPSTPDNSNQNNYLGISPLPKFSIAAGYYENGQNVSLSGELPTDKIYYTLDGAEPDTTKELFDTPIYIDTTTVIKATLVRDSYVSRQSISKTYIIGQNSSLPVISFTIDPYDLNNEDNGMFVHLFSKYEKKSSIEFFDDSFSGYYFSNAGVKPHGHGPAIGFPQHSIRFYARDKYDNDRFEYPFFGNDHARDFDKLLFRNGGNEWGYSLIRNSYYSRLLETMDIVNVEAPLCRLVASYLNGDYFGIYSMMERVDEELIRDNHNIRKDDINLLEDQERLLHGDKFDYIKMYDRILALDMDAATSYNIIDSLIDIYNFIDYMIFNIYAANHDWPEHNRKFWNAPETGFKWQWYLTDLDWTTSFDYLTQPNAKKLHRIFSNADTCSDPENFRFSRFFIQLLNNEQFKNLYINRTADLLNTILEFDNMDKLLTEMANEIKDEIPRHQERWENSAVDWEKSIKDMRIFFDLRDKYLIDNYIEHFGLTDRSHVELNIDPPDAGRIQVSTITPDKYPWKGIYFRDVPLPVKAIPNSGYKFHSWSLAQYNNDNFHILLPDSITITAVFEKTSVVEKSVVINEIMYKNSENCDSDDWFELYNAGNNTIYLSGWSFTDEKSDHIFKFEDNDTIAPGGFIVVCRNKNKFSGQYPSITNIKGNFDFGLGTEDAIHLYRPDGSTGDLVSYTDKSPWPANSKGTGNSIELISADMNNNDGNNWRSSAYLYGSPGYANPGTYVEEQSISDVDNLKCFPNPANDKINIIFSCKDFIPTKIVLCDLSGKEVLCGYYAVSNKGLNEREIDISALSPGVYIARIIRSSDNRICANIKFVKR